MRNAIPILFLCLMLSACTQRRQAGLVRAADEKLLANQYVEASELLRQAITIDPESRIGIKALYKLGFNRETYLRDYEGAVSSYQGFLRLSHDPVARYEVQKRIAKIFFEQYRDPGRAVEAYKKLMALNPESLEADLFQFRVARAYFRENNFDQAVHEYQTLLERFPKSQFNARARYEIGNCYYMQGKYEIAIDALKQVLRHHSQSEYAIEAQFLMAESLEQQDKLQNALQTYENIRGRYSSPAILSMRVAELKKRLKQRR